ncbi:unnamed protein product [Thelazia callipaeda]|uniref:Uncharacterized protein n=1 Tax=Thelazia callipaeda TaxID=103827 RepID=A0A3P7LQT1_THECL|nr:unnamed protein product [Thelazia callipaeda]
MGIVLIIVFILQAERHFLGGSQVRIGPNKVAILNLKLMKKEHIFLCFSSIISFFLYLYNYILVFFTLYFFFFCFDYSGVFLMCVMGVSVFPIMMSGIFRGVYSFLAGLRSICQSYSYEIAFSLYFLIFLAFNSGYFDLHTAPFDFTEYEKEYANLLYFCFFSMNFFKCYSCFSSFARRAYLRFRYDKFVSKLFFAYWVLFFWVFLFLFYACLV